MGTSVLFLARLFFGFGAFVSAMRFRGFRLTRDNFNIGVALDGESSLSFIVIIAILY